MKLGSLLSIGALGLLGKVMAIAAVVDTAILLAHSHPGFGPLACLVSFLYMRFARRHKSEPPIALSFSLAIKRIAFLLLAISFIDLCLLDIGFVLPILSNSEVLPYLGIGTLAVALGGSGACFGYLFAGWLLAKVS